LKATGRRLGFEKEEFKKLGEEVEYFKEQVRDYAVFDTTDLRAAPEEQMRELCSRTGISFSPEMIQWDKKPVDFHTEQTRQSEKLWYDELLSSARVNPPTDIPPVLTMFPEFVRDYLRADNLPIYAELSKEKILKDDLRHELNEREFKVQVTAGNQEYLHKIGAIEDTVAVGEQISLKLKYIDPIYAVTNEPELMERQEFLRAKEIYATELKIVSDIVAEQDEHARELKRQNNGFKLK
jgi:hypothetical protein